MRYLPRLLLVGVLVVTPACLAGAANGVAAANAGAYSKAQAAAGAKAYALNCARCHGAKLQGMAGPPLKGPSAPIQGIRNVGYVYHFVSTQMPLDKPRSLSPATYAEIVAFILQQNGHPAGPHVLTPAAAAKSTERI